MPHNNNHRKHHCTRQSSTSTNTIVHDNHHAFANLSGQCDGTDFSDHLSGFAATIGQRPCRWRIRHPMMILCMPHAFTICWQLASGDWEWERENSITVDTSLPHESIQYRTIERGGRDARKIEAEEPTIIILWIMYNIDSFIAFIVHLHAPWRKNGRQSRRK